MPFLFPGSFSFLLYNARTHAAADSQVFKVAAHAMLSKDVQNRKARFPLPELTGRVPVTRQLGSGRQLG